jgi:energy-coupling factor transporter transmembrane protein EcfT
MVEINNESLILVVIVVVGLVIIKLLGKFTFRIVGAVILLLGIFIYTYFYTNIFSKNQDNKVVQKIEEKINFLSVIDYQAKHCGESGMTHNDSLRCECIIDPLVKDLKANYTEDELNELKKDKQKYRKELVAALKRNQGEIIQKLKERNAIYIWNLMVKDLKKGVLIGEEK